MKIYNRIMELFWLAMGIIIIILVTVMCLKENFSSWAIYYVFALMALGTYFMRRFMRKRMEKHQAFLDSQKQK
jgi:cell division protein FtsW (lipid II flippase)